MPLDPSIILGGKPAQIANPLEAITTLAQLEGVRSQVEARRLAADEARRKAADEAAVRRVLTATGGDVEAALPQLRQIAPQAALEFETEIATRRQKAADTIRTEFDYKTKQFDHGLKVLAGMNDPAGYRAGRPMIAAMSPDLAKFLPDEYDPAVVQRLSDMALSAADLHKQRQEGFTQLLGKDPMTGLTTLFKSAKNQQHWDTILAGAKAVGAPQALLDQFGATWSPEAVQHAADLGISSEKAAELEGQAAARAQTAAHQAALEAQGAHSPAYKEWQDYQAQGGPLPFDQYQTMDANRKAPRINTGSEPLVAIIGPDGQPVLVPRNQAVGARPATGAAARPATGAEHKALSFYNRGKEALDTLTTPDATGKSLEDQVSGVETRVGGIPIIGNYLQSAAAQRYTQAQRAFTEARLRQESGATIRADEYENDRKTYFKQPGDSPAVVAQKKKARETVLNGLAGSAGKAYEEYYGEPFTRGAPAAPPPPAVAAALKTVGVGRHTLSDGSVWEKHPDGSIVKAQ